ncbi:MAG: hypothetical protein ABIL22_08460 [candidate division WOR-3 bacterium]
MDSRRLKDTDQFSEEQQIKIFKKIPGEVKLSMSLDLTRTAIELLKTGIKQRHPEYSDNEIENALKRLLLTDELYEKVYNKC